MTATTHPLGIDHLLVFVDGERVGHVLGLDVEGRSVTHLTLVGPVTRSGAITVAVPLPPELPPETARAEMVGIAAFLIEKGYYHEGDTPLESVRRMAAAIERKAQR